MAHKRMTMITRRRMPIVAPVLAPLLAAWAISIGAGSSHGSDGRPTANANRPEILRADGRGLQKTLDEATSHSIVMCNRNEPLTLSAPITIRRPLTLQGLNARLPKGAVRTPLVVVEAEGVAIVDFELRGNRDSVPQTERSPLLVIQAGDFRVERGLFVDSSKDGVMIHGEGAKDEDLVGGVVRDVVGRGNVRDVVSVGGMGSRGGRIRNLLIDNVRCYGSSKRGAVEVSDGTDNVTVRKVYAERSVYALDVQDHGKREQINTNVVIQDVYAVDCVHAIRTANHRFGHDNLTMRDIAVERCAAPLKISNTNNVTLHNVSIIDHPPGQPPISIANCDGVSLRDVTITNSAHDGPAVLIENCNDALIDGVTLRGDVAALSSGVCFRLTADEAFSGLRIHNVLARNVKTAGIVLQRSSPKAALTDYTISGNLAVVSDGIQGQRATLAGNTP